MIVADTNLIAYLVIKGQFTAQVEALYRSDPEWVVPRSWRAEFLNVLTTYCRKQELTVQQAVTALELAQRIAREIPFEPNDRHVIELSVGSGQAGYDCIFVAAAKENSLPLVTFDQRLSTKFPETAVTIDQLPAFWARRNQQSP